MICINPDEWCELCPLKQECELKGGMNENANERTS